MLKSFYDRREVQFVVGNEPIREKIKWILIDNDAWIKDAESMNTVIDEIIKIFEKKT